MTSEEAMRVLAESRKTIDALDLRLVRIAQSSARAWWRRSGGPRKRRELPIYEPKREEDVFRNVTEHNRGPLTADAVKSIFERIIDEMRNAATNAAPAEEQGEKEC